MHTNFSGNSHISFHFVIIYPLIIFVLLCQIFGTYPAIYPPLPPPPPSPLKPKSKSCIHCMANHLHGYRQRTVSANKYLSNYQIDLGANDSLESWQTVRTQVRS